MINLIIGKKGTGKTKRMIKLAQDALHQATGQVVFIDDDKRCMSELNYKIRFINTTELFLQPFKEVVDARTAYGHFEGRVWRCDDTQPSGLFHDASYSLH